MSTICTIAVTPTVVPGGFKVQGTATFTNNGGAAVTINAMANLNPAGYPALRNLGDVTSGQTIPAGGTVSFGFSEVPFDPPQASDTILTVAVEFFMSDGTVVTPNIPSFTVVPILASGGSPSGNNTLPQNGALWFDANTSLGISWFVTHQSN